MERALWTCTLIFIILCISTCSTANGATVTEVIEQEAVAQGFDPDLAIAIATVESNLNPKAVGALGEQGLFQLRPEYHRVVQGDARANVRVAISYLNSLRNTCGPSYGSAYFVCFNTGSHRRLKEPTKSKYYRRVLTLYREQLRNRKARSLLEIKPYVTKN